MSAPPPPRRRGTAEETSAAKPVSASSTVQAAPAAATSTSWGSARRAASTSATAAASTRPAPRRRATPKRAYHHGNLEEALLAAAVEAVDTEGADAFSLRQAARAVDVDPATVYRHYADKDALLRAVARQGFAELIAAMEAAIAAVDVDVGSDEARFRAVGEVYVRSALARPHRFRLMFGPVTAALDCDLRPLPGARDAQDILRACVAALRDTDDAKDPGTNGAAVAAWSLVHGLTTLILDGRLVGDPEVLLTDMLQRAVALIRHT